MKHTQNGHKAWQGFKLHKIIKDVVRAYEERWKSIEEGQLNLKQNLVRYNNFIREKQSKVADGISYIVMEKQKQNKVSRFL